MEFAQFQHCENHISRLGDDLFHIPQLYTDQVPVESPQAEAVWLGHQLRDLLVVGKEPDVIPLPLIFARLPVDGVVHELVEVAFHFVLCRRSHDRVLLDVGGHPGDCAKRMTRCILVRRRP